ncbi:MAG: murein L,D-transpeptidase [Lentisphaeraceae bacterium]|nr:murein L,D-transpeptidase [Lentisphaeraceae bacterium]
MTTSSCKKSNKVAFESLPIATQVSINIVKGSPVFMRIFKEESELELWTKNDDKFELYKTFPICNWSGTLGPKLKEGDGQSPEGFYFVNTSQLNPNSRYHLAFNIGYPNAYDRSHDRTGSYIMVHGDCVSIGCYAMNDVQIEEIYRIAEAALDKDQSFFRIHIFPFRMNTENMEKHKKNKCFDFWLNLKEGYDAFEKTKLPPNVESYNGRYIFN